MSDSIDEKRVYGGRGGRTRLLVAADVGVVGVSASDGRVGEFGIEHRCSPRDIAGSGNRIAVATDEDVLLGSAGGSGSFGELEASGFGPAIAVGVHESPIAAGPDGRIARHDGEWEDVGVVEDVAAIDGDLVGAGGGVYRIGEGVSYAGLSEVRDVSAAGMPLAATARGLYALGNGWMDVLPDAFRVVASDGERAHAATEAGLYERRGGGWEAVDLPADGPIVDVAYADCPYAITPDGTLLSVPGDGEWRAFPLGLSGVAAMVAGP